jgi:hypothetical protein
VKKWDADSLYIYHLDWQSMATMIFENLLSKSHTYRESKCLQIHHPVHLPFVPPTI